MNALKQQLLKFGFPKSKINSVTGAYDMVGDIAVLEIPLKFSKYAKLYSNAIFQLNPRIRVVAKKWSVTSGKYRVRKVKSIAGEKRTSTTHRESNCSFKIDLNKAYFSTRLAHERERIAAQVQQGERVLVLFAGVGPFAIVAAKKQPRANFVGVELNPAAVKLFEENIILNKAGERVKAVKADAKKFLSKKENQNAFDRVVMPLPHSAHEFLAGALGTAKEGGIVHFYFIPSSGKDSLEQARKHVEEAAEKAGRKAKIVFERSVLTYAPHVDEVVLDVRVD